MGELPVEPPFIKFVNAVLLSDVPNADIYLAIAIITLALLAVAQKLNVFTRPPPVPLKKLPRRPALQVLFKPDDAIATAPADPTTAEQGTLEIRQDDGISLVSEDDVSSWGESHRSRILNSDTTKKNLVGGMDHFSIRSELSGDGHSKSQQSHRKQMKKRRQTQQIQKSTVIHGLPDSFAPLLSSSEMDVLWDSLTADLIHAVQLQAQVRLHEGRHSIPLDKDDRRPQFWFDSKNSANEVIENDGSKKGCKISASFTIGSERFSLDEDLDTTKPTLSRSRPMVKSADLVFDPPLRLGNVAPTLLHFPDLFEDRALPRLRRMQIIGFIIEFLSSLWFLLEKTLWMIERRCQVHLSKVKATPIYRGTSGVGATSEWRLSLSFTGHLLLFGWIPFPFISYRLPTFIIPQPHALLEYLLTAQPFASARLRRENISEEKIVVASLNALDSWSANLKAVVTPPALEVDLTLPGGITVAVELMHGRDAPTSRKGIGSSLVDGIPREISNETLSTWMTNHNRQANINIPLSGRMSTSAHHIPPKLFDANSLVPWYFETSVSGSISRDRIVLNVPLCTGRHQDDDSSSPSLSMLNLTGSIVICRAKSGSTVLDRRPAQIRRGASSNSHLAELNSTSDAPPIHSLLLYPDTYASTSKRNSNHLVEYDYAFDVGEETILDAISLSYGASHPMLKGGTIISCMLESIYAYGSVFAREGAIADPSEKLRKRNFLRHLPAIELSAGIQKTYIPKQSTSYFDDGNTRSIPEMEGGRVMIQIIGGNGDESTLSSQTDQIIVKEGIKIIADFGVSSFSSNSETNVNEFPELDIFEGSKLCTFLLGTFDGCVIFHLRPQVMVEPRVSTGPNVFNPLEAYEIDFSGSCLSLRIKECSLNLGHRRVIVPTETTFAVNVIKSLVNMSFEGTTQCELSWDFQGSSPILQVTSPGQTPAHSSHEDRQQVPVLIKDLCQGRLNMEISPVGGLSFTQASTSREDKEGLYDWKFFNAIVSPDEDSPTRIRDVLYDKKTMYKLLAVTKLINADLEKVLRYILTQVWRAKEIFDQEGISEPGKVIPGHKMARLISLFLCGDISQVDDILPIIRRVVAGDGLDVVRVKELLRKHVENYDEWAAEFDRAAKWAAVMLGPMTFNQGFVECEVPPSAESNQTMYAGIPTAKEIYDVLRDKPQLPLDPSFSNLISRIAPYMTFRQISYVLNSSGRPSNHWQPFDLKRLRYVYSVKKKVQEISESYGGLSFLPQSFFVSIFLGEATRSSLRAPIDIIAENHVETETANHTKRTVLSKLRRHRLEGSSRLTEEENEGFVMSPAGRVASLSNLHIHHEHPRLTSQYHSSSGIEELLGDSLLGPQDVAVLLQAGLTSVMKGSTVVQLNQRMLLDLMASQPRTFAIAVLAELGTPGSQGVPRALTSALMAFIEMDQSSFKPAHRIDVHNLLESWLPGLKIPRRDDYLAGGRWARQSYYDAIFGISVSILDLAEVYSGLKLRIQRVRHSNESDPVPVPKEELFPIEIESSCDEFHDKANSKLATSINAAKEKIAAADDMGKLVVIELRSSGKCTKQCSSCAVAISAYKEAFEACAQVLSLDKNAFQAHWFKSFFRRNYDALMVKSVYDNVMEDVDNVRVWMDALRRGSSVGSTVPVCDGPESNYPRSILDDLDNVFSPLSPPNSSIQGTNSFITKPFFTCPEKQNEQDIVDAIIAALFYDPSERDTLAKDPLVRLLIPNDPGNYNFTIITAMGVITEGKKGRELEKAVERLEKKRGVITVRADTGTARSVDYNANRIEEAVEQAVKLGRPYGLVGYSQGCANEFNFESLMLSGTPDQQKLLTSSETGLVCRQLLFSAANGSVHGPAGEAKAHQLITMSEDFFKYQQGYFSRAFISSTLNVINDILDSAAFQKFMGGKGVLG
ncbi:hypothetical protein ACHAXS_007844 [Conticribra weissflogii]